MEVVVIDPQEKIPDGLIEEMRKRGRSVEVMQVFFGHTDEVRTNVLNPLLGRSEDEVIRFINAVRDDVLNPFTDEIVIRKVLREKDPKTVADLVRECLLAGVPI